MQYRARTMQIYSKHLVYIRHIFSIYARLIVPSPPRPPLWFMDSNDPDRSYALASRRKGIYPKGSPTLPGRVQTRIPISLNRQRLVQVALWSFFFFNASTRRSWVILWGIGVREHSYFFSPRTCTREKSVRFSLYLRGRGSILFRKIGCRQALRVAQRCVTCRLTLYCRGNGCSDPMFHSNITARRQIRSAIGVKRLEGRTERGLCSDDIASRVWILAGDTMYPSYLRECTFWRIKRDKIANMCSFYFEKYFKSVQWAFFNSICWNCSLPFFLT